MKKNIHPLPEKRSDLLEVALADLELAEKSPLYSVCMATWHEPVGPKCEVCFAGAVMAFGLADPIERVSFPSDYPEDVEKKLAFLNHARAGFIRIDESEEYTPFE